MEEELNKPKHPGGRPKGSTEKTLSKIKIKNKELVLKSLEENMGILAPALKVGGMCRETFNKYYDTDLDFRKKVDEIREQAVDYVEGQLLKQIKQGGAAQTIFYLKTKGKHRGYIEQTDSNMTIDAIKIKYIIPEGGAIPEPPPIKVIDTSIKLELPDN